MPGVVCIIGSEINMCQSDTLCWKRGFFLILYNYMVLYHILPKPKLLSYFNTLFRFLSFGHLCLSEIHSSVVFNLTLKQPESKLVLAFWPQK